MLMYAEKLKRPIFLLSLANVACHHGVYGKTGNHVFQGQKVRQAKSSKGSCFDVEKMGVIDLDFNPAYAEVIDDDLLISSFFNVEVVPGGTPPLNTLVPDKVARISDIKSFDASLASAIAETLTDLQVEVAKTVWPNEPLKVPDGVFPFKALLLPQGFHLAASPGRLVVLNMESSNFDEYVIDQSTVDAPRFYHNAIFADLDNDGFDDIIAARSGFRVGQNPSPPSGELVWFKNPGSFDTETEWEETILVGGMGPDFFVAAHDFTGDGNIDIVATHLFTGSKITIYGAPQEGWESVNHLNPDANVPKSNDIMTGQGVPFEIEIVDLNQDGRFEVLTSNHQADNCNFPDEIDGKVIVLEPPTDGDIFVDQWTSHIILDGIRPQPTLPGAQGSRLAPGHALPFFPTIEDEMAGAKPLIVVSGDEAGKVWVLKPDKKSDFKYKSAVIFDINDTYGPGTTQTPLLDPFGITISTIGNFATRYDDNGFTVLYVPVFEGKQIYVFRFDPDADKICLSDTQIECIA